MRHFKEEGDFRKGQCYPVLFLNGWIKHVPVGWCALTDALSPHRESFAVVKGAVHLLEDAEKTNLDEDLSSEEESEKAPDSRSRQLHAMVEHLRPEDTMKLVSINPNFHISVFTDKSFQAIVHILDCAKGGGSTERRVFPENQLWLFHSIFEKYTSSVSDSRCCLVRASC